MRTLLVIACLALLAVTFAGCSDPERYPDGVPQGTSTRSQTGTSSSATRSATHTASSSATSTGPGPGIAAGAPTATLKATPPNGTAPLNVTFDLSGSDPDGDNLTWVLVFGDGNQTNGTTLPTTVKHVYAKGNHTASLTVSDGSLNRTATAKVSAAGPGAAPAPTAEDLCPTDPLAVGHETAGYYVTPADNVASPGATWIYQESNGMPGLQRNDDTVPTDCPTPDTIIF
ncbi:MAG TPA: PKD domain-containing protein [Candidatus Thermoplasmatota archaeon]|nr:PKD domain-containing protein [Candidatus Thermoplasmatota archaeon]